MRARLIAFALLAGTACAPTAPVDDPPDEERLGEATAALTVSEAVTAGCATAQVLGLSLQIVARGNCIAPGAYVFVPDAANVTFGGSVLRYLEAPARDALSTALESDPGLSMQVNSLLRTVAQQFLLYSWYLAGQCGIGLAAVPGGSNHETGLAIDLSPSDSWRPTMTAAGFSWLGASDPVHFDYAGADAVDYRGVDVLAFQQLWNENHPDDPIAEDGDYGPQTEARLTLSPADGFPVATGCGDPIAVGPGDPTHGSPVGGPTTLGATTSDSSASCGLSGGSQGHAPWLLALAAVTLLARRRPLRRVPARRD